MSMRGDVGGIFCSGMTAVLSRYWQLYSACYLARIESRWHRKAKYCACESFIVRYYARGCCRNNGPASVCAAHGLGLPEVPVSRPSGVGGAAYSGEVVGPPVVVHATLTE